MRAQAAYMSPGRLSKLSRKRIRRREPAGVAPQTPGGQILGIGMLLPSGRGKNLYRTVFPGTRQRRVLFYGKKQGNGRHRSAFEPALGDVQHRICPSEQSGRQAACSGVMERSFSSSSASRRPESGSSRERKAEHTAAADTSGRAQSAFQLPRQSESRTAEAEGEAGSTQSE